MMVIDTRNMCSHLHKKLFEEDGIYHPLWKAMQDDAELTAVVRSRQLHIYRNGKKVLVLAGKSAPKIIREDKLCEMRANKEDADVWLAKGGAWSDDTLSVWALGSTDSGVSWIVETEGKRIFHAGDLNNWYARFLPEAVPGETIYSEEFDEEIDPIAHEKQYLGELKDIRKITDSFDVVMFPVDGRIGNGYTLGGRQFIERFKVGLFVPMHFVASGFESAWRMKEFTDEKGISFWEIRKEGETIDI